MVSLVLAATVAASPTPGPLQRAGQAADRALQRVAHSLEEAVLEGKVKVALLEHLKGEALAIEVEAVGSTVVLSGKVRERSSLMVAEEVVRSVKGVSAVKNLLTLEPEHKPGALAELEQRAADQLLEGRVKLRLLDSLGRAAMGIEVEASSGVVVLSGTVAHRQQRDLAATVARATSGVRQVHNLLRVER